MDARTPAGARRLADIRRPKKRPTRANGDATRNKCNAADTEAAMRYLVPFLTAGLQGLTKQLPATNSKQPRPKRTKK